MKHPISNAAAGMKLPAEDGEQIAAVLSRTHSHRGHRHQGDACTVNQMLQAAARYQMSRDQVR